ncbi:hypothetical protein [Desulforamulus aeronauticus]|uniref:Uncharacterized protein n=1 Tax=Desulforamulus aeronauticus DSM 10349 TaxID=1121421 RepID=A0A1M6WT29_9FIRM|nr:hypothetical protein [Desulforamulus aeronauticus]SHK96868.1 hypothetical protein SAMN02745123_03758 [Desulforamulus aeronauticus DSM 10349]
MDAFPPIPLEDVLKVTFPFAIVYLLIISSIIFFSFLDLWEGAYSSFLCLDITTNLFKILFYVSFAFFVFTLNVNPETKKLEFGIPSSLTLNQIFIIALSIFEAISNFLNMGKVK